MRTHDLLGGEDAAWVHMEGPDNPMVVTSVVELGASLRLDRARPLVDRLLMFPRFRSRLVEPLLPLGRPAWVPVDVDLAHHVERIELAGNGDGPLLDLVGLEASRLLDPSRPLWKLTWVERPGAGTAIVLRSHHAIADGFALLYVLASLCEERSARDAAFVRRRRTAAPILRSAQALGRLVTLPADPETLLKQKLGSEKRVAWSRPIALADVKGAARFVSGTVNDVLVAVVAGALGRYLARRGEQTTGLELHAMVPVNLRDEGPAKLGNRFGLVVLGLPIGIDDPIARISAVRQRMRRRMATPEAAVAHGLLRAMGRTPKPALDVAFRFFAKKTSLVLTNVPGPRTPVHLLGAPVTRIMFWVPQGGSIGLGISIFSYAGNVTVGVLADTAVIPDPDAVVKDLHDELARLEAEVQAELRNGVARSLPREGRGAA